MIHRKVVKRYNSKKSENHFFSYAIPYIGAYIHPFWCIGVIIILYY